MNAYVFEAALREFARLKRVLIWIVVAAGLYGVSKVFLSVNPNIEPSEAYPLLSSLLTFRVLPLASAIFSSAVLSQEVEQKTIVYVLTRPIARWRIILARALASVLVVALVSGLSAVTVSAAVYGGGAFTNAVLYRDLTAVLVGALAYGFLFVLISLIVNRSMIVSLLFAFAWETSVPSMPGNMYWLSISSYITAIAQRPSVGTAVQGNPLGGLGQLLGTNPISAETGWTVLISIILICAGLSMWWFSNFEYLPREDAE